MTTWPSVTCPSPPSATPLPRRTLRMVVPWNVSMEGRRGRRREAARRSGGLAHEVARRDADEQQQRADDRRRAGDLHRLALRFDAADAVEHRAGADEVDALDGGHVDG